MTLISPETEATDREPVYVHRYQLQSRSVLNARSIRTTFPGALIRIGEGFGCLHPWTELGDPSLEALLADLAGERTFALTRQALACCRLDLTKATDHPIPRSHYLLPPGDVEVPEGFDRVKLKCSGSEQDLERIRAIPERYPLRLDFNETLSDTAFRAFWRDLGDDSERIELVEDPCPFAVETWKALEADLGCQLALDHWPEPSSFPSIRVIKPAAQSEAVALPGQKRVFTSYMDHPVGQCFAASIAAKSQPSTAILTCGLVTQHLFDDADPFIAAMGPATPEFRIPPDIRQLLDALPWKRLTPAS